MEGNLIAIWVLAHPGRFVLHSGLLVFHPRFISCPWVSCAVLSQFFESNLEKLLKMLCTRMLACCICQVLFTAAIKPFCTVQFSPVTFAFIPLFLLSCIHSPHLHTQWCAGVGTSWLVNAEGQHLTTSSVTSPRWLEISHSESFYTTEIGKH